MSSNREVSNENAGGSTASTALGRSPGHEVERQRPRDVQRPMPQEAHAPHSPPFAFPPEVWGLIFSFLARDTPASWVYEESRRVDASDPSQMHKRYAELDDVRKSQHALLNLYRCSRVMHDLVESWLYERVFIAKGRDLSSLITLLKRKPGLNKHVRALYILVQVDHSDFMEECYYHLKEQELGKGVVGAIRRSDLADPPCAPALMVNTSSKSLSTAAQPATTDTQKKKRQKKKGKHRAQVPSRPVATQSWEGRRSRDSSYGIHLLAELLARLEITTLFCSWPCIQKFVCDVPDTFPSTRIPRALQPYVYNDDGYPIPPTQYDLSREPMPVMLAARRTLRRIRHVRLRGELSCYAARPVPLMAAIDFFTDIVSFETSNSSPLEPWSPVYGRFGPSGNLKHLRLHLTRIKGMDLARLIQGCPILESLYVGLKSIHAPFGRGYGSSTGRGGSALDDALRERARTLQDLVIFDEWIDEWTEATDPSLGWGRLTCLPELTHVEHLMVRSSVIFGRHHEGYDAHLLEDALDNLPPRLETLTILSQWLSGGWQYQTQEEMRARLTRSELQPGNIQPGNKAADIVLLINALQRHHSLGLLPRNIKHLTVVLPAKQNMNKYYGLTEARLEAGEYFSGVGVVFTLFKGYPGGSATRHSLLHY